MESLQVAETKEKEEFLNWTYQDSEIVIGLVGAVGTQQRQIVDIISERLGAYRYTAEEISVSKHVIAKKYNIPNDTDEYRRISTAMDRGNLARKESGDNGILALGVADEILRRRNAVGNRENELHI